MPECDNCGGKMEILKGTPSKLIWKCVRCGYEEETIRPAPYDDWRKE